MPVQWQKVYIFISSTFNDMHAERDYLVKQVFPRLREWCESRKLRLVDIDLRWGVTEQDAQNLSVVKICLDRIDDCRPFFLCFLGQRRGWVPGMDDISSQTYAQYPDLRQYAGAASVTEIEILHAVLNPLHGDAQSRPSEQAVRYERAKYAFFFLRQPGYLDELPADPPQLRQVYTNESIQDPARHQEADLELERWREVEIPRSGRPVHRYTARWDVLESTPEIKLPLHCPTTAAPGSAAWDAAFRRWAESWAQAGVQVDESGEIGDPVERQKALQFNSRLAQGRLRDFTCIPNAPPEGIPGWLIELDEPDPPPGGSPLADIVLADLKAAIQARYPQHNEADNMTPLQRELDQQEQFLETAGEGFIERTGDFVDLDRYIAGDSNQVYVLTAPGGMGKTSLLAAWIDHLNLHSAAGESLHYRFIGASDGSAAVNDLMRFLLYEIQSVAGKFSQEIPADPLKLRQDFPKLLEAAGEKGKTILLLDGLNQLASGLADMAWLPQTLPADVKLVISFKRGDVQAESYYERLRSSGKAILKEVRPFESLEDRRTLVITYLDQFLKELDQRHLETLIHSQGASNPLFLKVVLAELRIFGAFSDLGDKIRRDFGMVPLSAFNGVLQRLESDPLYSPLQPELLAPHIFGWLAHARLGLTIAEMSDLLIQEGLLNEENRAAAEEAVNGLLRQMRVYLARREGRVDFFYESLKLAALARYAPGEIEKQAHLQARLSKEWHAVLARYFERQPLQLGVDQAPNRHKLAELAFQYAYAGEAEGLKKTLWDYAVIEARLQGFDVDTLIADYDLVTIPAAGIDAGDIHYSAILQETLQLSAHVLRQHTLQLPAQLTGRLLAIEHTRIPVFLESIRREVAFPWLRPINPCLESPEGSLVRTLEGHAGLVHAVALTLDGRIIVSGAADYSIKVWNFSNGECLRTLTGHRLDVSALSTTPDGRRVISGSIDHTIKVWDLESGNCLRTLEGHNGRVNAVAVTPDGRRIVSGAEDNTLKVWDLESGECLFTHLNRQLAPRGRGMEYIYSSITQLIPLQDGQRVLALSSGSTITLWDFHNGDCLQKLEGFGVVRSIALAPGGKQLLLGTFNNLSLVELESGKSLLTLEGHTGEVFAAQFTTDGRYAISGAADHSVKLWDLESISCANTFNGHVGAVRSLAISPDGKHIISGSADHTLKIWRLGSGESQRALEKHANSISQLVITPDGRRAISGSWDNTLKVWDLSQGRSLHTLAGHSGFITAIAVTPDNRMAISGSWDHTLKLWSLDSGECLHTLHGHSDHISSVAIISPGRFALSVAYDNTLRIWDLENGMCLHTFGEKTGSIKAAAITPDGRHAVIAFSHAESRYTLKIWNLENKAQIRTLEYKAVNMLEDLLLFPDLTRIIIRQHGLSGFDLVDLLTGNIQSIGFRDFGSITCLTTSPDGRFAFIGFDHVAPDGKHGIQDFERKCLLIHDLQNGISHALAGHQGIVRDLAVTPDGRRLVSGSAPRQWHTHETAIKLWDLESRTELASFDGNGSITCVRASPDGKSIVAGDEGGQMYILRLENSAGFDQSR